MSFGGAKKCPLCGKSVYHAEQALAGGKAYHKLCLRCTDCGKSVDSLTMAFHEDTLYCKSCHGKSHGPTGYGYGVGAGTLTNTNTSEVNTEPVNKAEVITVTPTQSSHIPHAYSQVSPKPASMNDRAKAFTGPNVAPKDPKPKPAQTKKFGFGGFGSSAPKPKQTFGSSDKCPRCGKSVYAAEKAMGPGGKAYHKLCLRCTKCDKSVDSMNMTDKDGVLYCKGCYGKEFGPTGYGYGQGAGTLHNTGKMTQT